MMGCTEGVQSVDTVDLTTIRLIQLSVELSSSENVQHQHGLYVLYVLMI